MGKIAKHFTLLLIFLVLLIITFVNTSPLVRGQSTAYKAIVNITSPIQNQTYNTNNILLSFTFDTNIKASNTHGVVFVYALDGQTNYHTPDGTRIERIGEFYPPLSSSYSTIVNVPNGKHLIWVQVDYYTNDNDYPIEKLSQIVNFTVNTGLPEFPLIVIVLLFLFILAIVFLLRHRKTAKA
jgi:hypothetical protein